MHAENLVHAGRQLQLLGMGGAVPGSASRESTFGGSGSSSLSASSGSSLSSTGGTIGGSWSILSNSGSGVGNGNNNFGSSAPLHLRLLARRKPDSLLRKRSCTLKYQFLDQF